MRFLLALCLLANQAWSKVVVENVREGNVQPQASIDSAGVLHLVTMSGKPDASDIWYVSRAAGKKAFSRPLRVNSTPGNAISMGTIRGARMAAGRNGGVYVVWNGKGSGKKMDFSYARLDVQTGKFSAQRNFALLGQIMDGGGAVAADEQGGVLLAWTAGDGKGKGDEARKVWVARSSDDGMTFSKAEVASSQFGVCPCCGMAAGLENGNVSLLYRAAVENKHRGMHLVQSSGKGWTEKTLDDWEIEGCPMTQSSFLKTSGAPMLAAWENDGKVFASPAGLLPARFTPVVSGKAKYPALAASAKKVAMAWAEGMGWGKGGQVVVQEFEMDGRPTGKQMRMNGLPAWSLPAVVAEADGDFRIFY